MNELLVSTAGYLIGLVITAVVIAPVGVVAFFFSSLFYFVLMGATIVLARTFKDKSNPSCPNLVVMSGLIAFISSTLVTASVIAGLIVCISAMAITKKTT